MATDDWAVDVGGAVSCGVCRRSFDPGTRFCPFDSEELAGPPGAPLPTSGRGSSAKICPSCTEHYASEESFCGRDGSELVAVN